MGDVAGPVIAVGEVRTPLPAPDLGDTGLKPATQTKAIGIIYPPPDIRAIVDKTAQFVARNGTEQPIVVILLASNPTIFTIEFWAIGADKFLVLV